LSERKNKKRAKSGKVILNPPGRAMPKGKERIRVLWLVLWTWENSLKSPQRRRKKPKALCVRGGENLGKRRGDANLIDEATAAIDKATP